jgi:hypothetical protein
MNTSKTELLGGVLLAVVVAGFLLAILSIANDGAFPWAYAVAIAFVGIVFAIWQIAARLAKSKK